MRVSLLIYKRVRLPEEQFPPRDAAPPEAIFFRTKQGDCHIAMHTSRRVWCGSICIRHDPPYSCFGGKKQPDLLARWSRAFLGGLCHGSSGRAVAVLLR